MILNRKQPNSPKSSELIYPFAQGHSTGHEKRIWLDGFLWSLIFGLHLCCSSQSLAQFPGIVVTNNASREWYNAKEKVKFQAEFVSLKDGLVFMKKQNQMTHRPLADLSQENQDFLTKPTLPSGSYTLTRELDGRKDSEEVTVKATGSCITVVTKRIGMEIPHKGYIDGKNISLHAHAKFGASFAPIDTKLVGTWDASGATGTLEYSGPGRPGGPNRSLKGKFTLVRKDASSQGSEMPARAVNSEPQVPAEAETLWTHKPSKVTRITLSDSGKYAVTHREDVDNDQWQSTLWDLATGKQLGQWRDQHYPLNNAHFSATKITMDDKYFVTFGKSKSSGASYMKPRFQVRSLPDGKLCFEHQFKEHSNLGSVTLLSPPIHICVACPSEGMFHLNLSTLEFKRVSTNTFCDRVAVCKNNGLVIVHTSKLPMYKNLRSYFAGGEPASHLEMEQLANYRTYSPDEIVVSPDSNLLATEDRMKNGDDYEAKVRVYNPHTSERVFDEWAGKIDIQNMIFAPDSNTIFATGYGKIGEAPKIMKFDVKAKKISVFKQDHQLQGVTAGGAVIAFKSDYKHERFVVYDPTSGDQLSTPLAPKWIKPPQAKK